jgi:P-type conjugative transfer protein TrbJ
MKTTLITIILTLVCSISEAQLVVHDPGNAVINTSNLVQSTTTALKQVAAYAQQVQQYQLQITQYKNQLLNTTGLAPTLQLWQQISSTMNSLMGVSRIFQSGSSLTGTLNQYQNLNYWLQAPPTSYTNQNQINGSALQVNANAALLKTIQAEQTQITADSANLQKLQATAGSTQGQKQALDAASGLAALMNAQLLKLRNVFTTGQQSLVAKQASDANTQAMQQAATHKVYGTVAGPQTATEW